MIIQSLIKMFKEIGNSVMFRFLALILSLSITVFSFSSAFANPYIVVDVQTGRVLAHNEAFDRWYPASLTKLMTAYVTFRALQRGEISLETPIRITTTAAQLPPSKSGYKAGSTLTLDTALKIMMVKSANDIATSIGTAVGGSDDAFVARMNSEATRIGMVGSHFANASGLPDPANYSTARDLAVLAAQIRREFPQYAHYFNIPAIDYGNGAKLVPNTNNLIGRFNGADGMKTGFICSSGFNLAASATRKGRILVAVVLGAERIDQREGLSAQLLNDGFKSAGSQQLTLVTLRPYGSKLSQATDLRQTICTETAWQERLQYRDENGKIQFSSPFMSALDINNIAAIPVRLLAAPPVLKAGQVPDWKVPVPVAKPSF